MGEFYVWSGNAWNWIAWQATHMTLATALWIGLGILTLVLLILMRTRWGQVAPIWKCAVLSIFAHILLAAYAYGTRLILEAPAATPTETFSLTMVDPDSPNDSPDEETTRSKPWDEVNLSSEVSLNTALAQRVVADPIPIVTRTVPELTHEITTPSNTFAELPAITPPAPLPLSDDPPPESANVADRMQLELSVPAPSHELPNERPVDAKAMQSLLHDLAAKSIVSLMQTQPLEMNPASTNPPATERNNGLASDGKFVDGDEKDSDAKLRPLADGREVPEIYSGRSDARRLRKATEFGGSLETEQAVDSALRWLAANQEPAGNWNAAKHGAGQEHMVLGHDRQGAGADADTGITGLALLAFLAAGNSHLEGPHREIVQHGLEYLINQQASDGNLTGNSRLFARMYCHAMAMFALSEALAVTGDRRLVEPVRRAVEYSLRSQDRNSGGWRYRPGDQGDMSQFGWQVMALKSARLGGIEIPEEATRLMTAFLQSCTSGTHGGLAGYRPGQQPTPTMTAEALLCRHLIYQSVPDSTDAEAARYLLQSPPGQGEINFYFWYYGTLAMFHVGGQDWENWNLQMSRTLTTSQVRDGEQAGSWEPNCVWSGYGGRVYSTALATLSLEVYYRYSR